MWKKGKINTLRTVALALIFAGIIVMYGSFLVDGAWATALFMVLGVILILISTGIYTWVGLLSTKAIYVICPNCEKQTKMLGRIDQCMHCNQALTRDPSLATDHEN